jgi:hypothetical protein
MKKETMLLSPPHSKRAKVTRSRVSTLNRPYPQPARKLPFLPSQTRPEDQISEQPAIGPLFRNERIKTQARDLNC